MSQPQWKLIEKSDDRAVKVDETGVYPPELEYVVTDEDREYDDEDERKYELSTVQLEKLSLDPVQEELVRLRPEAGHHLRLVSGVDAKGVTHAPWFEDELHVGDGLHEDDRPCPTCKRWVSHNLTGAASSVGMDPDELRRKFCSDDVLERAHAYEVVAGCHGYENFDQYPTTLKQWELDERWGNQTKTPGVHGIRDDRPLRVKAGEPYGCEVRQGDFLHYREGEHDAYGRVLGYTWFDGVGKVYDERMIVVLQAAATLHYGYIRFVKYEAVTSVFRLDSAAAFTRFFLFGKMSSFAEIEAVCRFGGMSNDYLAKYLTPDGREVAPDWRNRR